jgi:pyruvate kinase
MYLKDGKPVQLKPKQLLKIVSDIGQLGDETTVATSMPLPVNKGDKFFIGDGGLEVEVTKVNADSIEVQCLNKYTLKELETVNLPPENIE